MGSLSGEKKGSEFVQNDGFELLYCKKGTISGKSCHKIPTKGLVQTFLSFKSSVFQPCMEQFFSSSIAAVVNLSIRVVHKSWK